MPIVLVVDDSPVALRVLAQKLRDLGFDVHEESTVGAARSANPETFVCAIIDLHLGDGDGASLSRELRAKRPSLPVAFFTAGASPSLLERAEAQGPVFRKHDIEGVVEWARRQVAALFQPPPTK